MTHAGRHPYCQLIHHGLGRANKLHGLWTIRKHTRLDPSAHLTCCAPHSLIANLPAIFQVVVIITYKGAVPHVLVV